MQERGHLEKLSSGEPLPNTTIIYGEGGTGKTTICLLAALKQAEQNKKVIFLNTESNFSTERCEQLLNGRDKTLIENMLILQIKNFNAQHQHIMKLEQLKNVGLVIVDSLTHYYRRLASKEPELARSMLNKQLKILEEVAKRNIPIILSSQVFSRDNAIFPLAKETLFKHATHVIKLEKNPRSISLEKPEKQHVFFKIKNEGIELIETNNI